MLENPPNSLSCISEIESSTLAAKTVSYLSYSLSGQDNDYTYESFFTLKKEEEKKKI